MGSIRSEIRGMTISYSSFKAKERLQYEKELNAKLEQLEKDVLNETSYEEYHTVKHEIERIDREKAQGAIVRSRAKYVELGERNSRYFLNLEKKNQEIKNITCIVTEDNAVVTSEKKVLEEQCKFYEKLYGDTGVVAEPISERCDFLENPSIKKLSRTSRQDCEEDISKGECAEALRAMANNKSPGSDGFPTEFYKFFWRDIKDLVFSSFQFALQNRSLSSEQRRGVLTLIPKQGVDLRLLKSWRPLTLLNTDYKILAKVLSRRLQSVIDEVISDDQNGYIKGRYIGENIRTISDIIEFTTFLNRPGIVALVDFEKAFDTVNWSFLYSTLEALNFGPTFISWIDIHIMDQNFVH